jgi:PKD repeat protein
MKTLAGMMVLAAGLAGGAVEAQGPLSRIAYEACPYPCAIRIANADGPGGISLGIGVNPSWSADGMSLAYSEWGNYGESYVNVADLRDWTGPWLGDGYNQYSEPALSPDGARVAFVLSNPYGYYPSAIYVADDFQVAWLAYASSGPTWSPDGARIAFACTADTGMAAICAMDAMEGAPIAQLTDGSANAWSPAFAPDGRIRFQTDSSLSIMNADGTSVAVLYPDWPAARRSPEWSPDGARIAYTSVDDGQCPPDNPCPVDFVGIVNADGTGDRFFAWGMNPSWTQTTEPLPPIASFTFACDEGACTFDASASWDADGTIAEYAWTFGDGATASGAQVSHVYAYGTYSVTLTTTDDGGLTGTQTRGVYYPEPPPPPPPVPPVARFTSSCNETACSFFGYGSYDPDGSIMSYAWSFGDGTVAAGVAPSRTYAGPGTYSVTLTVTDDDGLSHSQTQNVVVRASRSHVGDLDRAVTNQNGSWTAHVTITVHDTFHAVVSGATVTGYWSNGGANSCTTNAAGQCTVSRTMSKSIRTTTLSVYDVSGSSLSYTPFSNHDPDGDSNGTSITVTR